MIVSEGRPAPVSSPGWRETWMQRALLVDMRDPQAVARRVAVGDAAAKIAGRGEAVELQRQFGTLIAHAQAYAGARSAAHRNRSDTDHPLRT